MSQTTVVCMNGSFIFELFIFTGMVERCHRTLESVITKVMEWQEDWLKLLNSVLFGMHANTHSSTGFLPIRMLFDKDPIMPFEMADKLQNDRSVQESENSSSHDIDIDESDKIFDIVQALSQEHKEIFQCADHRIHKAQKHQAKGYNNRNSIGTKFEVGMKVLKLDCHSQGCHLEKL